eukprot:CAMPEP_0198541240 /NCGR_PEP_ID=MMETSP1462-20131121/53641_1 /TAXON_ID=1333877 /ORGANISM="Brandtodinium nutriculum, Strain RCC3387" /LENGTH=110 /DNA_ID=CAMNT_0044271395 /DNA_START=124 /DNA_END=456 /DNA_ORIENTATION=+
MSSHSCVALPPPPPQTQHACVASTPLTATTERARSAGQYGPGLPSDRQSWLVLYVPQVLFWESCQPAMSSHAVALVTWAHKMAAKTRVDAIAIARATGHRWPTTARAAGA